MTTGFPYGAQVVAGTNAVAGDHNNARKDGLTRWLKFEVIGTLVVGNSQGGSFIMPFAGAVVQTYTITDSGSAVVRLINNTGPVTIESGINAASTYAVDTSPTNPNFVRGDKLTLDITGVTSGVHLIVMVEVLPTP